MDCTDCEGSGSVHEDEGKTVVCWRCEGVRVLFINEGVGVGDALNDG
jgi:hypothetical protein